MSAKDRFHDAVKTALQKDGWLIEVKSFLGASTLSEFHTAIGQCLNYRYALADLEPDRILYLAVPAPIYQDFFTVPFIQSVIQRSHTNLLVYDVLKEEIVKWQP